MAREDQREGEKKGELEEENHPAFLCIGVGGVRTPFG